jgi:hypothetical protein
MEIWETIIMKLTKEKLQQIIQEELQEAIQKESLAKASAALMDFDGEKEQAQIRNKADEMVDFGKWEKQMDKVSDDFEAAIMALEKPLLAKDKEGIAQARANIQKARVAFRQTLMQTSDKLFMYFMTVKKLGGILKPDEEKLLQRAFKRIKQRQAMDQEKAQIAKEKGIPKDWL